MREVPRVDYLSAYSLVLEGVLLHAGYDHDDGRYDLAAQPAVT